MEEKKSFLQRFAWVILALMIAAELAYTAYGFYFRKVGFMSDEVWCYGLANSTEGAFICGDPDSTYKDFEEDAHLVNMNEPISSEVFSDYIMVAPDERFDYSAVYDNQVHDSHPVLYYALLHTICSFFPDSFSFGYAFALSCLFLVIAQVFLYKLSRLTLGSEGGALLVCVLYGGSLAALSTFIFLRQYSLLTALLIMYAYFNARIFYDKEQRLGRLLPWAAVSAFLAFNSHYTSIAFIGVMTACGCICFFGKKQFRKGLVYGGTILGTLLLFTAFFPAFYDHVFNSIYVRTGENSFAGQLKILLYFIGRYGLGYRISRTYTSTGSYIFAVLLTLVAFGAPIVFLLRKSAFVRRVGRGAEHQLGCLWKAVRRMNKYPLMLLAGAAGVVLFANSTFDIGNMGAMAVRYIFCVFPFLSLLTVYVLVKILRTVPRVKRFTAPAVCAAAAGMLVSVNMNHTPFLVDRFPFPQELITKMMEGQRVLVVLPDRRFLMTNLSAYLYTSEADFIADEQGFRADPTAAAREMGDFDRVWVCTSNYTFSDEQLAQLEGYDFYEKYDYAFYPSSVFLRSGEDISVNTSRFLTREINAYFDREPVIEAVVDVNDRFMVILREP